MIRSEIDHDEIIDEALEEQQAVHELIREELKKMRRHDASYDAKFMELVNNVTHHIEEEESKMLPKAEDCEIDWETLSSEVLKRKKQLTAKSGATSKAVPDKASKKK